MAGKKSAAKTVGVFVIVKKTLGKITKLAVIVGIGTAVTKVVKSKRQEQD